MLCLGGQLRTVQPGRQTAQAGAAKNSLENLIVLQTWRKQTGQQTRIFKGLLDSNQKTEPEKFL